MDKETQVLEMAKILCPKGTANCEKCSKNYKCDVKFSQLAELIDGGCQIVGDDEIVESMKTYERARQEAAREIIDLIVDESGVDLLGGYYKLPFQTYNKIKREYGVDTEEYGIELE